MCIWKRKANKSGPADMSKDFKGLNGCIFPEGAYISSAVMSLLGLNLVESYPYETVEKGYDYVRLASITAGKLIFFNKHMHFNLP